MRLGSLAFLLGILIFQQIPYLPDQQWAWLLLLVLPGFVYLKTLRLPMVVVTGFLWALFQAGLILSNNNVLPPALEGEDLIADGYIASVPNRNEHNIRFDLDIVNLNYHNKKLLSPGRVRLSWYGHTPDLKAGERWRLLIRLKRPHGFMNPGGFDYEGWLFQHRFRATGYVKQRLSSETTAYYPDSSRMNQINQRLSDGQERFTINRWRQSLSDAINNALEANDKKGIIEALAIGERNDITHDQWQVFTRTGTNHLVAISGLHIGLIAGLVFFLARWSWSLIGWTALRLPAPKAAAMFALLAAAVYAALAGFSIPTQRALIMIAVVMSAIFLQRSVRPSHTLALALLIVLIVDPFAVMSAGFWLSFGAVAVIFFGMTGRLTQTGFWWKWGRVQWLIVIGLFPLMLILFHRTALIAPVANLVAVPWVSFLTVPLTLIASLIIQVLPAEGTWLLNIAAKTVDILWLGLEWLANIPAAQWTQHVPVAWTAVPGLIGAIWLLMPRGVPARWLGGVGMLPMILIRPPVPQPGEMWFTLLDVGQGLSAVVQTRNHVLVYDAGPRFNEHFDTGSAVVEPFLRQKGVTKVDILIISHGDNDHIGGAQSIMDQIPVKEVITGVPEKLVNVDPQRCLSQTSWEWDGVNFQILYPTLDREANTKENDGSCVLKVTNRTGTLLLTGDIERSAENDLRKHQSNMLSADILVVPHHGSNTSSTAPFVQAVNPAYALFSVGYRNRFGFPKPKVVKRYRDLNVKLLDTAQMGAISFRFSNQNGLLGPENYRDINRHYWNAP